MKKIIAFLRRDVWRIQLQGVSKAKAFWIRFLRIILLTRSVFATYRLQQGAATLTYYTLLGLVPMLVILLGVTRGFIHEGIIVEFLKNRFGNGAILDKLIPFADYALVQLNRGLIATIGIVILIWSAVKILLQLEITLNGLWNVKKARSLMRKFSDYLAMILFSPLLFLIANGIIFYLSAELSTLKYEKGTINEIDPLLFFLYNLLPYFLTSFLFSFVYIFMPNTRVHIKAALAGGLIAGALYQIIQWLYLFFQIAVTKHNPIYGTFAAIPLFLIWVHLSWVILLLGAKLAYAFQNVDSYEFMSDDFELNHTTNCVIALQIALFVTRSFLEQKTPPTAPAISKKLALPLLLCNQIIDQLIDVHLLAEVRLDEENGYQPALPIDQLTIKKIIDRLEERGETIPLLPSDELTKILQKLDDFKKLMEKSGANTLLKDL